MALLVFSELGEREMELTDEARAEFQMKLQHSVIDKRLLPYVLGLEKSNYSAFDRLVMLMLNFGDTAFIYGVQLAIHLDSEGSLPSYTSFVED